MKQIGDYVICDYDEGVVKMIIFTYIITVNVFNNTNKSQVKTKHNDIG